MPPIVRKKDKYLPPNMYFKNGAYHLVKTVIVNGKKKRKWKQLAKTLVEAMLEWAKIFNDPHRISTMNELFDRYMAQVAPTKAEASYKQNLIQMENLRKFFGELPPDDVTPVDIYKYLDLRALKAKVAPNREKALLSHVFSKAIRWGILKDNPCRFVKRLPEKPRDRYVTGQEFNAVRSVAHPIIKFLMDFAYISGQRISDILKIKMSDLREEGIFIKQNKTGTEFIIAWSEELRSIVEEIKKLPRSNIYSMTLFCNKQGQKITYSSFKGMWKRALAKALDNKTLLTPFHFHDLRAKTGSDGSNIQASTELLGHKDSRITERVYNRKIKIVKPLK